MPTKCTPPTMVEKAFAALSGTKAKSKCVKEPVKKEMSNSIASSINWANKNKKG